MTTFIENQQKRHVQNTSNKSTNYRKNTWRIFLCSNLFKSLVIVLLIATIVPTICYLFVISRNVTQIDPDENYYCLIIEEFRIPCGKFNISQHECENIHCCFNSTTEQCHHYLPSKYFYQIAKDNLYETTQDKSPMNTVMEKNIKFTIQNKTANKLSLIIHSSNEVLESFSFANPNYELIRHSKKLSFEAFDRDNNEIILSATKGALIVSEKYFEWSFQFTNGTLFGLDRTMIKLTKGETLTKVIYKNKNDHSTLPVFWAHLNGKFYGIIIKHEALLEIQVLASNMIILRSLTGKKLEIELTLGGTNPSDLYRNQIDEQIFNPPFWSLGTQNCRTGDTINLKEILDIFETNRESYFNMDCIHKNLFISLQNSTNFRLENEIQRLKKLIREMREVETKFLLGFPPYLVQDNENILYKSAKENDILYKDNAGKSIYIGKYFEQQIAYIDFSHKNINNFLKTLIEFVKTYFEELPDGFILIDNWLQNDNNDTNVDLERDFPYCSNDIKKQMQFTIPWSLRDSKNKLHIENHNLYGQIQNSTLYHYFKLQMNKDLLIISSSKLYANSQLEIVDNLNSSWTNFNLYLNKILFNSIAGNSMVGLPICGDSTNYNKTLHETLCIRWYLAASTMPFFRVSSGYPFRDPANLNSKYAAKIVEAAMQKRVLFQDYFYTLMNRKVPIIRPMFYDFFTDSFDIFSMEGQYAIGNDIIVAQPLSSGTAKLHVYLPSKIKTWYEFWGGTIFQSNDNGTFIEIGIIESDQIMLIAEGSVVVLTDSSVFHIYVALNSKFLARGELFKDEKYLNFLATRNFITITGLTNCTNYTLNSLRVYDPQGLISSQQNTKFNMNNIPLCTESGNITIPYYLAT